MIDRLSQNSAHSTSTKRCLSVLSRVHTQWKSKSLKRLFTTTLLALVITMGSAVSTPVLADGEPRTRAQAIEIAKQLSGDGRVLSAKKMVNEDGVTVFAVKIISNGRVKIYTVLEFED